MRQKTSPGVMKLWTGVRLEMMELESTLVSAARRCVQGWIVVLIWVEYWVL